MFELRLIQTLCNAFTADILDDLLAMATNASGLLSNLNSIMVTMSQKSSLINQPKSVP